MLDSNYNKIISYEYDSWGKLISIKDNNGNLITDPNNIGMINSYRYRSYRYDTETGYYYLQSRYYNPEWGRLINVDSLLGANQDLTSYNLYAYVSNNPIMFSDHNGESIFGDAWEFIKGAVGEAVNYIIETPSRIAYSVTHPIETLGSMIFNPTKLTAGVEVEKIYNIGKNIFEGNPKAAGEIYGENLGQAAMVGIGVGVSKIIKSAIPPRINVNELKYTKTVLGHADRPYVNSPYTIQNIMKAAKPVPDQFIKGAYKWTASGAFNGTPGYYEIVINPLSNTVYHYLFRK